MAALDNSNQSSLIPEPGNFNLSFEFTDAQNQYVPLDGYRALGLSQSLFIVFAVTIPKALATVQPRPNLRL